MARIRNEQECEATGYQRHTRHKSCPDCGARNLLRGFRLGTYIDHATGVRHSCGITPAQVTPAPVPQAVERIAAATPHAGGLEDAIFDAVSARLGNLLDADALSARITSIAQDVIAANAPIRVQVGSVDAPILSNVHPAMPEALGWCAIRESVYLVGPAGTGKTTAAEIIADALGLSFTAMSVGPATQEFGIYGFQNAAGEFMPGPLFRPFSEGGLFLLDEIDSASAAALTALNSALANGYAYFAGIGMVKKHPDFVCIAAGNTYGTGADRMYVGRSQLDAATLDRFAFIDWTYDSALEYRIAQGYAESCPERADEIMRWHDTVIAVRKAVEHLKIRAVVSTRAIIRGSKALASGNLTVEQVANANIWRRLSADDAAKIKANI